MPGSILGSKLITLIASSRNLLCGDLASIFTTFPFLSIMNFEVVLESIEELNEVNLPTIKSVELCAGLQLGGITPSYATTAYFCEHAVPEVHVMIRPRAGGFNYNEYEFKLMVEDIKFFAKLGVTGVVFGLLDENFKIEKEHTKRLYFAAKELGLTRASLYRRLEKYGI